MKILSIDIGIKNLAFCLFEKPENSEHFCIKQWDSINICEKQSLHCSFVDKNQVCGKPAKFQKNNTCFCLKHSKKQSFLIPNAELKTTFINKQKIQKLLEIADKYKIPYSKNVKKTELISIIHDYIHNTCLEEIVCSKASNTDLITIGINIMSRFNALFSGEDHIDYVIIENQISPIANRMKTVQGMIAQYFIMSDVGVDTIEFISSINKLKEFSVPTQTKKLSYGERKKLGISKCLEIVSSDHRFQDKADLFAAHKKKDDLADSFLQGLWFINHKVTKVF
jgi:hypothetical protein